MYFLYIDESGSNTTHFVLAGIAIPALTWKIKSEQVSTIKARYNLTGREIHTGWMLRRYLEQERIPDFDNISVSDRIKTVKNERKATLLSIAATGSPGKLKSTKKDFKKTHSYIHLTRTERLSFLREIADLIGSWSDSRLFAEAVYKRHFRLRNTVYENSFENVVSRFDTFLTNFSRSGEFNYHGLVVQDNNDDVARRLTALMKTFHASGTMWTEDTRIIETPLFVNSELTVMIQVADFCAYAIRRFFENDETDLFNRIYNRFDRLPGGTVVGIRHYTGHFNCRCRVCRDHNS